MASELSELEAEKTALLAAQTTLAEILKTFPTTGKSAHVQEFEIGRTKVRFRSYLDVAEAINRNSVALERLRKRIRTIRQSNSQVQHHRTTDGSGGRLW